MANKLFCFQPPILSDPSMFTSKLKKKRQENIDSILELYNNIQNIQGWKRPLRSPPMEIERFSAVDIYTDKHKKSVSQKLMNDSILHTTLLLRQSNYTPKLPTNHL